jgi:Ca2+-binding RTX toxin-like protein
VTGVLDIKPSDPVTHPDVTALPNGGFAIAYEDIVSGTQHNIFYQTFNASGGAVAGPISVDASANVSEFPSIATLTNGNIAVAYDQNAAGVTSMFRAVFDSSNDTVPGGAASVFDNFTNILNDGDVVALPSGGFAVNYQDNGWEAAQQDITTTTFTASGVRLSFIRDTVNLNTDAEPKGTVSTNGYEVVSSTDFGGAGAINVFGTLLGPDETVLLQAAPLDTRGNSRFAAPVWIDASHISMSETNEAGPFVQSVVFDVVRSTSGDSATPLNFSGDGIDNVVNLGSGNDTVFGGKGSNYIVGHGGNDILVGGAGGGLFGGGNTIYALGGNNYLQGGTGSPSDVLVATGAGSDTFFGGSGNNYIVGGTGKNTIVGGGGALQTLNGSGSNGDYIVGGSSPTASNVLVEAGTGAAQLWGGAGTNYAVGGNGDDLVVGADNSDFLFGGAGNDTIYGGNGTDYIYPGPGNDFIWTDNVGSQSTDYIYEGVGTGVDTIADFTPGDGANHDVLVLTAASSEIGSFADVQAKAFQAGVYTVVPLSNTDQIYLYNVQPFQLTANDFIFT